MASFFHEIRTVLRNLLRSPMFTLITIVTLAVGIAANAAIFGVVHAVLIEPLPYNEPERLVGVWHTMPGVGVDQFQQAHISYLFLRKHNRVFEDVGIFVSGTANLTGGEAPEHIPAAEVSASLFPVLDVSPRLGRRFFEEEENRGAEPTVIISHGLWARRFGGDQRVLGQTIRVDGVPRTVVGVMPLDFRFPRPETEIWLPMEIDRSSPDRSYWQYTAIARLRPGIEPAVTEAEISALLKRLPEEFPDPKAAAGMFENGRMAALVHPLKEDVVGDVSGILRILLGSVGVILLIVCANVANLFLTRAEGRQHELALRTALGAGRGAVARTFLIESTVIALAGGALGLDLAAVAVDAFKALAPRSIPRLDEVGIDGPVLAFTLAISLVSSLAFGVLPAFKRLPSLACALREGTSRSIGGRGGHRARSFFVIAQLALALILMTWSGLMVRSFYALRGVSPGFDSVATLTLRLPLPEADYPGGAETVAFYQEVLERIRALPGVAAAGAVSGLPLTGDGSMLGHSFEDFPLEEDEFVPNYFTQMIVPGYLDALGIPLLAGRGFERADLEGPTRAVMVSGPLAQRLWPDQSPIGKRLTPARPEVTGFWYTIVGVVGHVRYESLEETPTEMIYYPLAPLLIGPESEPLFDRTLSLAVHTSVPPASLTGVVRSAIWSVDPNVPVVNVRTMEEIVTQARARTTFTMLLLLVASGVALVLGVVGLYGVISYVVSQRTHEIGIRMAMGAQGGAVRRMVLRQGLTLTAIGIAFGLGGAFAVTRLLESFLFHVSPTDPVTFGSVSLLLSTVALLASYLPARRAASMDPLDALRYE